MYTDSFIANVTVGIKENWDLPALSDYKKEPIYYREVAQQIAKIHLLFEQAGVEKGDKIVLCGRNCSSWAVIFLQLLLTELLQFLYCMNLKVNRLLTL